MSSIPYAGAKDFTVVIDAGHGGKDAGSIDNGVKEKDINLGVALKLGDMIKKRLKGIKVIYTRDEDKYLTLQQRADVANKNKGDLFISIHSNSVDVKNPNRKNVKGASTHVLGLHKDANNMAVARRENSVIKLESDYAQKYSGFDPNSDESYIIFELSQKKNLGRSIDFANSIQKELKSVANRKDNGVHQNGFWVLWATSMPAVLIELDFICNPQSAEFLSSKDGQNKLATAICNAVKTFYKEHKEIKASGKLPQRNQPELYESPDTEMLTASIPDVEKNLSQRIESGISRNTNSTKRRRRSLSSKIKSSSRNLEIESIEIKSAKDIKLDQNIADSQEFVSETQNQDKAPENLGKDKNNNSKKNKFIQKKNNKEKNHISKRAKLNSSGNNYKVQLLISEKPIDIKDPRFKKFQPIELISHDNKYSYLCGGCKNLSEAYHLLDKAKKNFSDAIIVTLSKPSTKNN